MERLSLYLLPQTKLSTAKEITERLRQKIQEHRFTKAGNVTVSFGLIEVQLGEREKEILKRVDSLLYQSKANGRNMVSH